MNSKFDDTPDTFRDNSKTPQGARSVGPAKSHENASAVRAVRFQTELPRPQIMRHSAEEEQQSKKLQIRSGKTIIIPTISPDVLREQTARSPNAWADIDFGGNQNDVTFNEMYRQMDSPRTEDSPGFKPLVPTLSQNILDLRHILEESSSSDIINSPDLTVTFDKPTGRLGRLGHNLSRSSTSIPRFPVNTENASRSRLNIAGDNKVDTEDSNGKENMAETKAALQISENVSASAGSTKLTNREDSQSNQENLVVVNSGSKDSHSPSAQEQVLHDNTSKNEGETSSDNSSQDFGVLQSEKSSKNVDGPVETNEI